MIISPSQYYQVKQNQLEGALLLLSGESSVLNSNLEISGSLIGANYTHIPQEGLTVGIDVKRNITTIEYQSNSADTNTITFTPYVSYIVNENISIGGNINLENSKSENLLDNMSNSSSANTFGLGGTYMGGNWDASLHLETKYEGSDEDDNSSPQTISIGVRGFLGSTFVGGITYQSADYGSIAAEGESLDTEATIRVHGQVFLGKTSHLEFSYGSTSNSGGEDSGSKTLTMLGSFPINKTIKLGFAVARTSLDDSTNAEINMIGAQAALSL